MKFLTWSLFVSTVVIIGTLIMFIGPPKKDANNGNSTATEEKKESSVVLKWRESGFITALPDRWTLIPIPGGWYFKAEEDPNKVRVKYYSSQSGWNEYKRGSRPKTKYFAYKSKTGELEMFSFRFTKKN